MQEKWPEFLCEEKKTSESGFSLGIGQRKIWMRFTIIVTGNGMIILKGEAMASIYVKMKNGTKKEFKHEGRAGGSYTKSIRYEGAFAIITDEWGSETAIPVQDLEEIKVDRPRYY